MYTVTHIVIINGEKTTLTPADNIEFDTIAEIDEYQRELTKEYGKTVFVDYKVPIEEHIKYK